MEHATIAKLLIELRHKIFVSCLLEKFVLPI